MLELALGGALAGLPPLPGMSDERATAGVRRCREHAAGPAQHPAPESGAGAAPAVRAPRRAALGSGGPAASRTSVATAGHVALAGGRPVAALVVDDIPTPRRPRARGSRDRRGRRGCRAAGDPGRAARSERGSRGLGRPHPGRPGRGAAALGGAGAATTRRAGGDPVAGGRGPGRHRRNRRKWSTADGGHLARPDLAAVLAGYGADTIVDLVALRDDAERQRIAGLGDRRTRRAVRAPVPGGLGRELLRAGHEAPGGGRRHPVHRPVGVGQVHDRAGAGRGPRRHRSASRHPARRRRGPPAPLRGAGLRRAPRASATWSGSAGSPRWWPSHGGIAIAAPIAPFAASRARVRAMAEPHGPFILVWVSTPARGLRGAGPQGAVRAGPGG